MMKLDELASRAGQEVRRSTSRLQPPSITEVHSSRRRRRGTSLVLGAFVGTLAVIGAVALWPPTGDTGPLSPPQPTTTIDAETPVEPSTRDYRLLDGRVVTITTHSQLTLQAYSFFIDTPDMGGERHVTVAGGDPAHVAEAETAEEEATLSDTATLWRADREGQPLFLSVDLGQWVVWLSVGDESSPPSTDALLQLAERLTGTADERGIVLEDLDLDYHELNLSGGQDELVTLRVGTCFNEMVPSSEIVEDPRWGTIIRSERRAAWCITDEELELEVHGPKAFVDEVVASIDITVAEPTTSPQTTTAATPPTSVFTSEAWELVADHPVVGRGSPVVVWTGNEVVVWGGEKPPHQGAWHSDGAAWHPESGTWREIADGPLSARSSHVAVWTGSEIIVCCGRIEGGGAAAGAYDLAADQWRVIASPPISPLLAEAVWTGEEMIVFGGVGGGGTTPLTRVAAYDPEADSWRELAELPHPIERTADAVFADGFIYVWPSWRRFDLENPPGPLAYNVETDQWNPLPEPPAEAPAIASVVWTGRQLFAYGANHTDDGAIGVGVLFDPSTGSWSVTESSPLDPTDWWEGTVGSEAAVWGDERVYIWTGYVGTNWDETFTNVVTYDPNANAWELLEPAPIPAQGLYQAPIIWTGTELITYSNPMVAFDR